MQRLASAPVNRKSPTLVSRPPINGIGHRWIASSHLHGSVVELGIDEVEAGEHVRRQLGGLCCLKLALCPSYNVNPETLQVRLASLQD